MQAQRFRFYFKRTVAALMADLDVLITALAVEGRVLDASGAVIAEGSITVVAKRPA